ncbi:hypothetical protein NW759_016826 [Fusarium solani]|nr:hypothetical protein NW759_016826 [Fusarium solani]
MASGTKSQDGFSWTPSGGLSEGLPTIGLVKPPSYFAPESRNGIFDVTVVGSGYAGLVAARDLATQGKKTLLVEARDRLGGRTWNSNVDGFNYELGGTWLHWHMPHIYREVSRYGLQNDWVVTQVPGSREDYHTLTTATGKRNLNHEEEEAMFDRVWSLFCNLDGNYQRQTWNNPFASPQFFPEKHAAWDKLSCQDRFDAIKSQLSDEEQAMLKGLLIQMGGADLKRMGLYDALRWWTLGGNTGLGLNEIGLHTRLGSGNSTLHRRIFSHAVSTGNLSYSFRTPVKSVEDVGGVVTVRGRDGQAWSAKAVIVTVPLNVLPYIDFTPPLPEEKQQALKHGTVNLCNKVHFDLEGPDCLSWSSFSAPAKGLVAAFGDRLTPSGDAHLVAFGPDPESSDGMAIRDLDKVKAALVHLLPEQHKATIKRIVAHDWVNDDFSRGTWCYLAPEVTTNHLAALQKPHGRIVFASSDYSDGWRGWIDGGVQAGMLAADVVINQQRKPIVKTQGRL